MAGTAWVADADVLAPVVDMDEAVYGVEAKSRCYDYRVLRHWIAGARRGDTEPLIENLPGFPDNLSAGLGGRFWLALILPRNKLLDQLSDAPLARTMIQRLPTFFRPQAVAYGHVVAIDGTGKVLASLQDPGGTYRLTTGALEARDYIYVGSLVMPSLGRLPKAKAGL